MTLSSIYVQNMVIPYIIVVLILCINLLSQYLFICLFILIPSLIWHQRDQKRGKMVQETFSFLLPAGNYISHNPLCLTSLITNESFYSEAQMSAWLTVGAFL